jgi:hypothetical protein
MWASVNGHDEVVRTLLEGGASVKAKNQVRNQKMMMIIIVLTIMMMMTFVINDEDGYDCR